MPTHVPPFPAALPSSSPLCPKATGQLRHGCAQVQPRVGPAPAGEKGAPVGCGEPQVSAAPQSRPVPGQRVRGTQAWGTMEGTGCGSQRHWWPKRWAVALGAGTPQGPHHLGDLSWLAVVSPAEDSSGTRQGLAAETLCTAGHQNHPKGSAHPGQPCWDPKPGGCCACAGNAGLPGKEHGNAPSMSHC